MSQSFVRTEHQFIQYAVMRKTARIIWISIQAHSEAAFIIWIASLFHRKLMHTSTSFRTQTETFVDKHKHTSWSPYLPKIRSMLLSQTIPCIFSYSHGTCLLQSKEVTFQSQREEGSLQILTFNKNKHTKHAQRGRVV